MSSRGAPAPPAPTTTAPVGNWFTLVVAVLLGSVVVLMLLGSRRAALATLVGALVFQVGVMLFRPPPLQGVRVQLPAAARLPLAAGPAAAPAAAPAAHNFAGLHRAWQGSGGARRRNRASHITLPAKPPAAAAAVAAAVTAPRRLSWWSAAKQDTAVLTNVMRPQQLSGEEFQQAMEVRQQRRVQNAEAYGRVDERMRAPARARQTKLAAARERAMSENQMQLTEQQRNYLHHHATSTRLKRLQNASTPYGRQYRMETALAAAAAAKARVVPV